MVVFTSCVDHRFSLPEAAERKITARKIRDAIFLSTPLSCRNDDQRPMNDEFASISWRDIYEWGSRIPARLELALRFLPLDGLLNERTRWIDGARACATPGRRTSRCV